MNTVHYIVLKWSLCHSLVRVTFNSKACSIFITINLYILAYIKVVMSVFCFTYFLSSYALSLLYSVHLSPGKAEITGEKSMYPRVLFKKKY